MTYFNAQGQGRVGWRSLVVTQVVNAVDADAQAFISAAGITNLTQASAVNTLVNDLKTYGLWTKMKALYPMVGGTATSHKFNLKDPRDLDAAYRLVFFGGITHTSTGALFGGTNGNAITYFNPKTNQSVGNIHLSVYSRTRYTRPQYSNDINTNIHYTPNGWLSLRVTSSSIDNNEIFSTSDVPSGFVSALSTSAGYGIGSRTSTSMIKYYKNGSLLSSNTLTNTHSYIDAYLGLNGISGAYASQAEYAFVTLGDGLSDTESTNLYNSVQKFQTTLGRQIGSPIVSDTDAQAFINAAGLTDLGQANAVNTLVTDLKAANIWTKMKAIYPFVGGTATTHKWNLKDPRDLNEAFRLVFLGGGTHTSNGYQLNGSNSWANTYFTPSINWTTAGKSSFGLYSTTNNTHSGRIAMGTQQGNGWVLLYLKDGTNNYALNNTNWTSFIGPVDSSNDKRGFFQSSRNNSTTSQLYNKNSNNYTSNSAYTGVSNIPIFIGTMNGSPATYVENINVAFSYIGEDLSATDLLNYYTAVQKYQTTLGRQV